jgi:hypothetical protein
MQISCNLSIVVSAVIPKHYSVIKRLTFFTRPKTNCFQISGMNCVHRASWLANLFFPNVSSPSILWERVQMSLIIFRTSIHQLSTCFQSQNCSLSRQFGIECAQCYRRCSTWCDLVNWLLQTRNKTRLIRVSWPKIYWVKNNVLQESLICYQALHQICYIFQTL